MSLRRVRQFAAAVDETSAAELSQQLSQFETNVSNMGDAISSAAMARLVRRSDTVNDPGLVVAPGQFQTVDTRAGTIGVALAKPKPSDEGTFIVLIDLGGGAGSIFVQGQGCKYENAASAFLTVSSFAALIFCDGVGYWKLS